MAGEYLWCHTEEIQRCTIVRVVGVLGQATYSTLRDTLLKCVIEQPRALIADVADVRIATATVLSVFTAVRIRTSDWPSIPILVATGPHHAELFGQSPIRRYVGLYDSVATALTNVHQPPPGKRAFCALPHDPGSPRAARQFVRRTCFEWELPGTLTEDAVHVASEFVQNTMSHTVSEARLRLELRNDRLTVAVGDDNAAPAVIRDPGSNVRNAAAGILLIAQMAKSWGCVTDEINSQKTVWAVLRSP
ncbi:hypothetical protein LWC34_12710 [Kibdelosporangium philippinense]|uniref:STAS domain-containing protein n=2 Tax=Kibdelosporangium philippinense TaxID=211113 RepID=A0ABS8Z725_9PSEU|nr:hypothetical protein [Kibdelosporangium philippinense]MCE7003681.1 hypothetical protein [Kibdelosporangium philippinense]